MLRWVPVNIPNWWVRTNDLVCSSPLLRSAIAVGPTLLRRKFLCFCNFTMGAAFGSGKFKKKKLALYYSCFVRRGAKKNIGIWAFGNVILWDGFFFIYILFALPITRSMKNLHTDEKKTQSPCSYWESRARKLCSRLSPIASPRTANGHSAEGAGNNRCLNYPRGNQRI